MIRHTLAALAIASLAGCSASSNFTPFASNDAEHAQLAAYAASNRYPSDMKPMTDMHVGAITNPGDGKVKIVNFSDEPVRDARVWIDGVYVHHVDVIPAHGSVSIKNDQFFDASGKSLAQLKSFPNRIEIENNSHLYRVNNASLE